MRSARTTELPRVSRRLWPALGASGALTAERRPRALDVQLTDDRIRMLEEP
jgi:hypothetical protein